MTLDKALRKLQVEAAELPFTRLAVITDCERLARGVDHAGVASGWRKSAQTFACVGRVDLAECFNDAATALITSNNSP